MTNRGIVNNEEEKEVIGVTIEIPNLLELNMDKAKCVICKDDNALINYECLRCYSTKLCTNCSFSLMEQGYTNCPVCQKPSPWCRDISSKEILVIKPNIQNRSNILNRGNQLPERRILYDRRNQELKKYCYHLGSILCIGIGSFILGIITRLILGHCVFTCEHLAIDIFHSLIIGILIVTCIIIISLCCGICCIGLANLGTPINDR